MSSRQVLLVAVGLTLVPVLADLGIGGRTVPIRYFAADAFYYHTVARNIAEHGAVSFDGVHPTNGFHPLWQVALAALYAVSAALPWSEIGYLVTVLLLSALLVAASVWLVGLTAIRAVNRLPATFVLVPVGIYPLVLLPYWLTAVDGFGLVRWSQGTPPLPGTLWSYANGMESGLALVCYAGLAWIFVGRPSSAGTAALVGLFSGLLTLARLDHVFIAAMFPLFWAARAFTRQSRQAWLESVACALAAAVPILVYLAVNLGYAGALLPVSGAAKTTFPMPTLENFGNISSVLRSPFGSVSSVSRAYRAAQLVVPGLVALWTLQTVRPPSWSSGTSRPGIDASDRYARLLQLTAVGVLVLCAYDFLFVRTFAMGHWYVPVPALFASLAVFVPATRGTTSRPVPVAAVAVTCAAVLLIFAAAHRRSDYHWLYNDFYFVEAPRVRAFYGAEVPRTVEYDDGIIGFATGFPTMSGLGLMLDAEAARAFEAGTLAELALARGFHRAASLAYLLPDGAEERPPGDLGAGIAAERIGLLRRRTPQIEYEAEYAPPSGIAFFARAQKRESRAR